MIPISQLSTASKGKTPDTGFWRGVAWEDEIVLAKVVIGEDLSIAGTGLPFDVRRLFSDGGASQSRWHSFTVALDKAGPRAVYEFFVIDRTTGLCFWIETD